MRWIAILLLAACSGAASPDASIDAGGLDGGPPDARPDAGFNDQIPPVVQAVSPAAGAIDIPLNVLISASFSESIQCTSVGATTMVVRTGTTDVAGEITCGGDTITLTPSANLSQATGYSVTIMPGVLDLAGNALAAAYGWTFTAGDVVDTTPPIDPTITSQIPQTTMQGNLQLMGTKEANTNLQARWTVDGVSQHAFIQVVPRDALTAWTYDFPLLDGVNVYVLRSRDDSGNRSGTISFNVSKQPIPQPVDPPTVNFFSTTGAPRMVLHGGKGANQAIELDGVVVVPSDPSLTWDREVTLSSGLNSMQVRAVDGAGNRSNPVPVDIDHQVPPVAPAMAQLRVELELRDMWNHIGDEFRITNCDTEIDHYAVEIWIEGPFPYDANGAERCFFDDGELERKYTRYAATVRHHLERNTSELWAYPAFLVPNYEAALIEVGHWAGTAQPIGPAADRRDANGNRYYSSSPPCGPFSFDQGGVCRQRLEIGPPIDGITAASIQPHHDRNTGTSTDGATLGTWATRPTFNWNLIDRSGQRIREGAYLINVAIVLDRSAPEQNAGGTTDLGQAAAAPFQWLDVLATDRETCWDRAAHATAGQHRAEGIMILDGTAKEVFWAEKGRSETVDAPHNERAGVRFDGRCDWDGTGPDAFCDPMSAVDDYSIAPDCPAPNTSLGAPVRYLNTPAGWAAPVRVQYCPNGCP